MKSRISGLCLAVVGAGMAVLPMLPSAAAPPPALAPDNTLVRQMTTSADGNVSISRDKATQKVSFARVSSGGDLFPAATGNNPQAIAQSYVDKYAPIFGANPGQLVRDSVTKSSTGSTVTYVQKIQNVPVFGTMLRVQVGTDGAITAANGELVPVGGEFNTTPALSTAAANKIAVGLVRAQPPGEDPAKTVTTGIRAKTSTLEIYRHGLAQGLPTGKTELVYQIEVANDHNIRDMVFVSAETGKVVNRYSMVENALSRELYEADAQRNLTQVWKEGDPLPGDLNEDQASMVESTGEAYWLFKNAFGRDSYDGSGAIMRTINNDPAIQCPNANWNGTTTNYCDGVSSDDVVAHEWGHAYTEYTHNLIYQWQPGALNESYSDIWGETVDLLNGRLDEGEGDLTAKRPVGQCSSHSPASPVVTIDAPSSIAKECLTGGASFGKSATAEGTTADVVAPTDAVEEGGTNLDGCSPYDQDVTGKIVLVNRGLCSFVEKAQVATDAGAAALMIGNNDDAVIGMTGDNPDLTLSVSIGLTDREAIRTALANGETVQVSIKDKSGARVDSYRWLMGEKSAAFGGAIRDMWNPTCYGDPGKVSDAEYKCSDEDSGGVHSNSGVPNHGYALLVDGGTFNGVTVTGIGMDKAAAIYFKAMTDYQTPVSGFADHADALAASCAALTGRTINKLSVMPNDAKRYNWRITADNCAQVDKMAQAVELRLDPTAECAWQPQLKPGDPAPCGDNTTTQSVFTEDFAKGLNGWTQSSVNPYNGLTRDWQSADLTNSDTPPLATNASQVAFGPDPAIGQCSGDAQDFSSVNWLTSGDIKIPDTGMTPRLTFDHYIAIEQGFDGGTVQISVNGGSFTTVPADAYVFNAPGMLSTEAEQNTNPLAGQPGFTGSDPGSVFGSWGTSQIDLIGAGAKPGDTIALQFGISRDGCGGNDGWYLDNVEVTVCTEGAPTPSVAVKVDGSVAPNPVQYGSGRRATVKVTGGTDVSTGTVEISEGKRVFGTVKLANGTGVLALPPTMRPGVHTLTYVYSGDATHKPGESSAKFTVTKATTRTTATATPKRVKHTRTVRAKVAIRAVNGLKPVTGAVRIFAGKKLVGSGTANNGMVNIAITRDFPVGARSVLVKYLGNATLAPSKSRMNFAVVR